MLGEHRINDGNREVSGFCIEHTLYRRLQPPRHGNIVGIDAQLTIGEFALELENVSRSARR
jgi:hypothetical protein